jgi:hypothetical protein
MQTTMPMGVEAFIQPLYSAAARGAEG